MMKASELQIGDIVWITDDIYVKVKQITKRKIGFHLGGNNEKMSYARLCEIGSVDMDEDLIFKLGFKVKEYPWGYRCELDLDEYLIEINTLSNSKNRDFSVHIDNADRDTIASCDIQYLHQLQQIIRLATGKELEVKL